MVKNVIKRGRERERIQMGTVFTLNTQKPSHNKYSCSAQFTIHLNNKLFSFIQRVSFLCFFSLTISYVLCCTTHTQHFWYSIFRSNTVCCLPIYFFVTHSFNFWWCILFYLFSFLMLHGNWSDVMANIHAPHIFFLSLFFFIH